MTVFENSERRVMMNKNFWKKREAALERFMAAKKRNEARIAEITES